MNALVAAAAAVGLLAVARAAAPFARAIAAIVLAAASPARSPRAIAAALRRRYGALGKPSADGAAAAAPWAVVTGASDGIGKEFAVQLAAAGFSVLLVARNPERLNAAADAARAAASAAAASQPAPVHVRTFSADLARPAADPTWAALEAELAALSAAAPGGSGVAILVNNAALSHAFPVPFAEEATDTSLAILAVNNTAPVRLARLLLPPMLARAAAAGTGGAGGLVLNVGSVTGLVPSALLAAYSASKAFLRCWSVALSAELAAAPPVRRGRGTVRAVHHTAFFVATAMSKIRRPTLWTPTPRTFVRACLASVAFGDDNDCAPYPPHALMLAAVEALPEWLRVRLFLTAHKDIRTRALRKLEREAAAARKSE
ncbi:hypothetical protein HK405_008843 [Cladochytrium tenue]|nr:hypothetical protein HK405_008843 [Cladochytrium tenue]